MPTPRRNERESDFMSRCIPEVMGEGKPQGQAIAQCQSMWDNRKKKKPKRKTDIREWFKIMFGKGVR